MLRKIFVVFTLALACVCIAHGSPDKTHPKKEQNYAVEDEPTNLGLHLLSNQGSNNGWRPKRKSPPPPKRR